MLRPPAEVAGSRAKYYNNKLGAAHLTASWVNMLLHTELATRDSARVFVRYADLLDDWVRTTQHVGETLDLRHVLDAKSEAIRDGHRFIDPSLRRITATLDDLDLPGSLRELTAETWTALDAMAEPGGDTADRRATLDQLLVAYVDLYAEAEAISKSSVVAATTRPGGVPGGTVDRPGGSTSRSPTARWPTGSRTPGGRRSRRRCGRGYAARWDAPGERTRTCVNLEGHHDFDITWPWTGRRRLRRGQHRGPPGEGRGGQPAVRAAAAAAVHRPGAARRQPVHRRDTRGRRRGRPARRGRRTG